MFLNYTTMFPFLVPLTYMILVNYQISLSLSFLLRKVVVIISIYFTQDQQHNFQGSLQNEKAESVFQKQRKVPV